MDREYGVNVCSEECGMLVVAPSYDMRYRGVMWTYMENPVGAELRYCPFCGTRVGVERRENGSIAWREAMVPRAALMKLAWQYHAHVLLLCASDEEIAESEEVWLEHLAQVGIDEAALKAAEEATQSE
jgi:hypothetical protein